MSKLVLNGDTSGSVTLDAPAVSGTTTLTLPTTSGTVIVNSGAQTIEFADGSASTPSITNSGNTNTGIFFPAADTIAFAEGGAESMRIDSNSTVCINSTSPPSADNRFTITYSSATQSAASIKNTSTTFSGNLFTFYNASTNQCGAIVQTGTTTTAFTTSSDYRLKENIVPMTGALDKVLELNPVTYTWKEDGSDGQGFIAHELQEIIPDCVIGQKNALDKENNPKYQQVDTSFLVATLTAAIQEQQTIINDLKARVETLEGAA